MKQSNQNLIYKTVDHEFISEKVKIDFALLIDRLMHEKNVTRSTLAELTQKKPSYITRVMGGNCNLTIETMSQILAAMGEELHITAHQSIINEYTSIMNHYQKFECNINNINSTTNNQYLSDPFENWVDINNNFFEVPMRAIAK